MAIFVKGVKLAEANGYRAYATATLIRPSDKVEYKASWVLRCLTTNYAHAFRTEGALMRNMHSHSKHRYDHEFSGPGTEREDGQ